ncbi:hypothetical protein V501_05524 [Pseudogymnoascus sp. VKM F-4519 (FW-2642)]|nr:hypothetical protein V501_05524 [Pseudogymnoascus sp. VKM F-4519 (FW-2642)]
MMLLYTLATVALAVQCTALSIGGREMRVERDSDGLQNIVTYDEHSLMVHGERIFVYSGEFHPYRLPVPDLWLDVFQKIKALGFNAVSYYVHWALLEGEKGKYLAEGIFDQDPFYEAAQKAGIYLIARPGPYINAESSGGGFPGWLQRVKGQLRTRDPEYLAATDNYIANIGASIAKAQITNGGPLILVQPENEYSLSSGNITGGFPDPVYFSYVKKQLRNAGIVVPLISNDAWAQGIFAPGYVAQGSTAGDVDIYGHDGYPLGFNCAAPYTWPAGNLPTDFHSNHVHQSPSTFYSINEFQGGSFDPWGGPGFDQCKILLNNEFERVFYKNNYASGVALLNIYMIYGGTNWGNLGHSGGYTSYDYGAAISENREVAQEKYSELKLQAQFLKVSPAYLTASVGTATTATYTDSSTLLTTPLWGSGSATNFYVVRHSDYQTLDAATYKLSLKTSQGNVVIPQLGGSLTLSGRDSKWHVTDYDVGGTTLLYSTAEIFTWKKFKVGKSDKTALVVYGGSGEQHEISIITGDSAKTIEGTGIVTKTAKGTTTINWKVSATRRVVQVGSLFVYILDRNSAYNYWVPDFARNDQWGAFTSNIGNATSVIVESGYLVRSVYIDGSTLHIDGDLNATAPIKVIGAPVEAKNLHFNNEKVKFTTDLATGDWSSTVVYAAPKITLPELSKLDWKYLDNLPEIQPSYDDSAWTHANHATSNNSLIALQTPTSLYGSDYGYNTGILIYRGNFVATGKESTLSVETQGGSAYGSSVWANSIYVGSWAGTSTQGSHNSVYSLPKLAAGKTYVLTILVDNNGLDENWVVGPDGMKQPRGILNYSLDGHAASDITWKLTGNLGGEAYIDKVRGPLNEGGLYAERQGFTQPNPPNSHWAAGHPETGIKTAGVAFYQASFSLDLPSHYDIPLTFNFGNTTINGATADYRVQLWVNGYQFGKYANNIGPQSSYPVPQGILNYNGQNWIAVELWAQQESGAHLTDFTIKVGTPAWTSMEKPKMAPIPSYTKRKNAY